MALRLLLAVSMFAASGIMGACATPGAPAAAPAAADRPSLSGTWEGLSQGTVPDGPAAGDTRIERQLWRLAQEGEALTGVCVVELTMISGDGRPYLCSREPRLEALIRIELRGRVTADGARIDEVSAPQTLGPCSVALRAPRSFQVSVRDNVMLLADGESRLSLTRRPASAEDDAAMSALLARFSSPDQEPGPEPALPYPGINLLAADEEAEPGNAEGFWFWEHASTVAGGDEKSEREEWHLVQEGARISGHYDRWVRQVSTDGHPYRCSGTLEFRVGTRYRVTGEVRGNSIVIYERGFEVLEGGPCDRGRRRLDAYQGRIGRDEIRLLWGAGVQVLRRGRPDVPTQAF